MNIKPFNNTKLYGYNHLFSKLVKLYSENRLPNKIIFSGNKGIGKSTLAYHLTNYILSTNENNEYDLENKKINENNSSYKLISKNIHPNFFLISNDDEKPNIQISKIREMINFTNKSSFNNECKIIIIDNIEYLNKHSINALLKVIEEPNYNINFFLIHNNKNKILDTLNSRCIKFNLFLNNDEKEIVLNNLLNAEFYSNLNSDFKNIYSSPGDIIFLHNFFIENNINEKINIDNLLKFIINKSLLKKNIFIKDNFSYFIELYFLKLLNSLKKKEYVYSLYKYFLLKLSNYNKYNLDFESVIIEFNNKVLNE